MYVFPLLAVRRAAATPACTLPAGLSPAAGRATSVSSSCLPFYQGTRLSLLIVVFLPRRLRYLFQRWRVLLLAGEGQLLGGIILLHARVSLLLCLAVFLFLCCSVLSLSLLTFPGVLPLSAPLIAMKCTLLHIAAQRMTWARCGKQVCGILQHDLRCSYTPLTSVGQYCIHGK